MSEQLPFKKNDPIPYMLISPDTFEGRVRVSTGGLKKDWENDSGELVPRDSRKFNRGVDAYTDFINGQLGEDGPGFSLERFKGKHLLDLGSGAYESFGLDARKDGVEVVSLNPALVFEEYRDLLLRNNKAHERQFTPQEMSIRGLRAKKEGVYPGNRTVAGLGQALPFRAGTFDGVVSVFAVPHYLHSSVEYSKDPAVQEQRAAEEVTKALNEIVRVLKPGGTAYLVDTLAEKASTRISDGQVVDRALETLVGVSHRVFEQDLDTFLGSKNIRRRTICLTKTPA